MDLKAPDVTFRLIVCSCSKDHGMPVTARSPLFDVTHPCAVLHHCSACSGTLHACWNAGRKKGVKRVQCSASSAQVPSRLYFGREVSSDNARRAVGELALPKRAYLGPTSMDTEMSLIMCNQAKACTWHLGALKGGWQMRLMQGLMPCHVLT